MGHLIESIHRHGRKLLVSMRFLRCVLARRVPDGACFWSNNWGLSGPVASALAHSASFHTLISYDRELSRSRETDYFTERSSGAHQIDVPEHSAFVMEKGGSTGAYRPTDTLTAKTYLQSSRY